MPGNHGLRLDDDQGFGPALPQPAASCAALNGILAQVAEEFGDKFGSNLAYNGRVDVL
jgi:hypothetical protein